MNRNLPQRQQGAALVIGLVLLMILTLLGVTGMTTSTLELAMADNMQRGQYAFQGAESALHSEMRVAPPQITLDGDEVRGDKVRTDIGYTYNDANGNAVVDVDVNTTYQGVVAFGEGARQLHFESRGIAETRARGARSAQRLGYFVLGPGSE